MKAYLAVIASLFLLTSFGQKGTHSPYSIFGIGELNKNQYAAMQSMGGVTNANTDSTTVNHGNPASYSYIHRHLPIFQIGMNGKFSRFETETNSSDQRNFTLNQFQLGIPIKKRWGAGFGVKPYSFSGYQVSNYITETVDTIVDTTQQYINEGSGGISNVYLGVSVMPIKKVLKKNKFLQRKPNMGGSGPGKIDTINRIHIHKLSMGANVNYLFGSANRIRSFEWVWPILGWNSRVEDQLRISDVTVDLGLNYQFQFQADSSGGSLALGLGFSPGRNVRAFRDLLAYTYGGSFYSGLAPGIIDTVQHIQDNKGSIYIPETYKVGLEYRLGPKRTNSTVLRVAADLNYQAWSKYNENFGDTYDNQLRDRLSVGFGLEWTPKTIIMARSNSSNFLASIHYRIGFNYTQTELRVLNNLGEYQNIDDYGMSFGLGIPVGLNNRSNTNINFGAKFGKFGTTENGLIQEKYIGVFVGLSITPGFGSYWFVKRKYN